MAQLERFDAGRWLPLVLDEGRSEWTIGREPGVEVELADHSVSRRHAKIEQRGEDYWLADCGSRNGTRCNGAPVQDAVRLRDGDRIAVCDHELRFRLGARAAAEPIQATLLDIGQPAGVEHSIDLSRMAVAERPTPQIALDAVLDLSRSLGRLDVPALAERLLEVAFRLLPAASRGVVLVVPDGASEAGDIDGLRVAASYARSPENRGQEVRISRSVLGQALDQRRALLSTHVAADAAIDASASLMDMRVESLLCVPILDPSDDRPLGAIELLGESQARRFEGPDLELLTALASAAAVAIQNVQMVSAAQREAIARDRLNRDLTHAREIQRGFLPHGLPAVPGYRFFAYYESAQTIGGDYYLLDRFGTSVGIAVGDVSGKGLPAALLMAHLSSDVRFALLESECERPSPATALARVNASLRASAPESRFVTLFLAVLDPVNHRLHYANAGHPPAILRRQSGGVELLRAGRVGVPLNVLDTTRATDGAVDLEPGDVVALFSDGVTERRSPSGEEFGEERMERLLAEVGADPEAGGERLLAAVRDFAAGRTASDDTTFVCFGRVE